MTTLCRHTLLFYTGGPALRQCCGNSVYVCGICVCWVDTGQGPHSLCVDDLGWLWGAQGRSSPGAALASAKAAFRCRWLLSLMFICVRAFRCCCCCCRRGEHHSLCFLTTAAPCAGACRFLGCGGCLGWLGCCVHEVVGGGGHVACVGVCGCVYRHLSLTALWRWASVRVCMRHVEYNKL